MKGVLKMTGTQGKKVAIVVADGFEQVELEAPRKALREAGYSVDIVSPIAGSSGNNGCRCTLVTP